METVEVDGLGKVIGKFDTGNGTLCCVLHGDKVEEKGKTLYFEIGNKKFKKKIEHRYEDIDNTNNDVFDGIDAVFDEICNILESHNIDIDELIN